MNATQPATRDPQIARLEALFSAVVADVLDTIGLRDQVMAPRVRPLFPGARLAGRASTVRVAPTDRIPDARDEHYKLHLVAIDTLKPHEVLVVSTLETCFWGELMSVAAAARGGSGVVIDGYARDVDGIEALGFPTFVTGVSAADALGRSEVVELACDIVAGDVAVRHGDLLIGDRDGVVVVPQDVADQVLTLAEAKVSGENTVRKELEEGSPVTAVFEKYGIL